MKAGINRCCRKVRSSTMPSWRAFSISSLTSPPVPASAESKTQWVDTFVSQSGWT